jgi:hypothetical protein
MKINIVLVALAFTMMGCAVNKTLVPTGGSRADGVVRLSYNVGPFETPMVDFAQGRSAAAQRCGLWGYTDAEPFGGSTSVCHSHDQYGDCTASTVTYEYQCTGQK